MIVFDGNKLDEHVAVQATNPNLLKRFSLTKLSLHLPIIQHQNQEKGSTRVVVDTGDLIPVEKDIEYLAGTGFGRDETNPFVLSINEPYIIIKKQVRVRLPFVIEGKGDSYIATVECFVPCPSWWFRVKYMLGLASLDVELHVPEGGGQIISASNGDVVNVSENEEDIVRLRPSKE